MYGLKTMRLLIIERLIIKQGLSPERARDLLQRDGPNELTAPTTTPEWVKLSKQMFGGFSLLLWTAAGLCFAVYSVQSTQYEDPIYDNVSVVFCLIKNIDHCAAIWHLTLIL